MGRDWHHPGTNTPSVRRFTVPRDGRVTITGRVYKADTNKGGGDGVRLSIRHGARTVWKAEIDGDDAKKVLKLMDALEDLDDVQRVSANFDIPDEVFQQD